MHTYAAFIGHQPHVSLAELSATVPGFHFLQLIDTSVVVFESATPLPEQWLSKVGGTVIIAELLPQKNPTLADVPQVLLEQLEKLKGKVTFALRCTGLSPNEIRKLYRDCKDFLRKNGKASRYVGNERKPAVSVLLHDAGLISGKEGREICVIRTKENLWIGVTHDAQDIEAYAKRDMKKPVRDTTVGLLPPKLAQILLNFGVWLAGGDEPRPIAAPAEQKETKKKGKKPAKPETRPFLVYDPFCGTGVIPIECLLRGYAVLASDKSEKAVNGCDKNLEWVRRHWEIKKSELPSKVWKQDAVKPFKLDQIPDAVVTETSLGPNLRDRPGSREAQGHRNDNEKLQEEFLKNAAATLPGVPLVCIWPVWYSAKGMMQLEKLWDKLAKIGYEPVLPPQVNAIQSGRTSLLYRRPDQLVGREIVLLRPRGK